jgi:hypothetical protein
MVAEAGELIPTHSQVLVGDWLQVTVGTVQDPMAEATGPRVVAYPDQLALAA